MAILYSIMVGVCVLGYKKTRRGEGKRLGSREAGFGGGEECGSRVKHRLGTFFKPPVMLETVGMGPG